MRYQNVGRTSVINQFLSLILLRSLIKQRICSDNSEKSSEYIKLLNYAQIHLRMLVLVE